MIIPRTKYNLPYIPSSPTVEFFVWFNTYFRESNRSAPAHFRLIDHVNTKGRFKCIECQRGLGKLESGSSPILTPNGWVKMRDIKVGDKVFARDGSETVVKYKTPPQYPKMFKMTLSDGTIMEVGDEHRHIVTRNVKGKYVEKVVTTQEMYDRGICVGSKNKIRLSSKNAKIEYRFKIPLCEPIQFAKKSLDIEPYVIGYGLANGSFFKSHISTHSDDTLEIKKYFIDNNYEILSSRNTSDNGIQFKLKGHVFKEYQHLKSRNKYIPKKYLYSSIEQRVAILQGLMDGDGSISKNGSVSYSSYSEQLANDVCELVRGLGGYSSIAKYGDEYRVKIKMKYFNPFRLKRKAEKWKPSTIRTKQVIGLEPAECLEEGYCIAVSHKTESYVARNYTVTHNTTLMGIYYMIYMMFTGKKFNLGSVDYILYIMDTVAQVATNFEQIIMIIDETPEIAKVLRIDKSKLGDDPTIYFYNTALKKKMYIKGRGTGQKLRGIRIGGNRPNIIMCDDLENDENVESKDGRNKLKKWFFNAVLPSIDPTGSEVIVIGTPLHLDSLLVNLIDSPEWKTIQLPAAEKFPVDKDQKFIGAWEDRFTEEYITEIYNMYKSQGKTSSFFQEYMLVVVPAEDRLFDMDKIRMYKYDDMRTNFSSMSFYISVDLAVSQKESADYTAITVLGISHDNNWFVVDGFFGRIKPDETIKQIFFFEKKWNPVSVIVEKVAFQAAMETFIQNEMLRRNRYFQLEMLTKTKSKEAVIKSLQPIVELDRLWFPEDYCVEFIEELKYEMEMITNQKILAQHDDLVDSLAQLTLIDVANLEPENTNNNVSEFSSIEFKNPYVF